MPRRRQGWWNDRTEEWEDQEPVFEDTERESEDVRVAPGIPTLYEIRKHIDEHRWNGGECLPDMSNEAVFEGQCEYASTALSEMLSANPKGTDWSFRKRGWFKGDLSSIRGRSGCDPHAYLEGNCAKHCHSWVEFKGKIYDVTFWQFGEGDEVRVYMFDVGDPRYEEDDNA